MILSGDTFERELSSIANIPCLTKTKLMHLRSNTQAEGQSK